MAWLLWRRQWRGSAAFAALAALLPLLPAAGPAEGETGRLRIVQPDIGQADKWRPGFDRIAADRLAALTVRPYPESGPAGILFWPEAAVTDPLIDERPGAEGFVEYERARASRSIAPGQLLATGGLAFTSSDRRTIDGATNSVFVLDKSGAIVGRYDKAHLVPYGEYLPMRPVLSALGLSRLAPGDLDFRPGPGPRTLVLPGGMKMGVQICYEIIFSGNVVDPRVRPDYIFNPSNDAWFGAWGPPQHLAQARLRAAEEGLPVIRATPTGISALIDSSGRLLGAVGSGKAGTIDGPLPAKRPPTPFAALGNVIPLALAFILLIAAIVLGRGRRYSANI
jgi:apolipoprotein N-acyltransferase